MDKSPEIAAAFGIRGVPTVILFKDGKLVEQVVGLREKSKYAALIDQLAAS
ncbi:thioredoxin domain-containing protein [Ochrobactrum sp. SFR4]|uniref:thioredoxin family protein n=1 Tax=Ochrobactrum sp. SFR4 TaxID=2717368 RepID=UPI00336A1915